MPNRARSETAPSKTAGGGASALLTCLLPAGPLFANRRLFTPPICPVFS